VNVTVERHARNVLFTSRLSRRSKPQAVSNRMWLIRLRQQPLISKSWLNPVWWCSPTG